MGLIAWMLVFLLGFSFLQLCCVGLKPLEKLGFSLPIGMGLSSAYMFLLDIVGIPVNNIPALLIGEALISAGLFFWSHRKHGSLRNEIPAWSKGFENPGWDVAYYLIMVVILVLLIMIGIKSILWPLASYDAVTGYDLLGKAIAAEGTLDNLVFDKSLAWENNRTGYPPLYPYNLAFARIFGAANPQVTCIFWYVPMAISFYALLRHKLTPLGSAIVTLLLISAPDYADFSSISSNNTPMAFYSGLGLISVYLWYDNGKRDYLYLGTALTAMGLWDRLEAVFFFLACAVLIFIRCRQSRRYRDLIFYSVISLLPFVIWELYLKYVLEGIVNINVRFYPFWDPHKIQVMLEQIGDTSFSTLYWGIVVHLCLILIAVSIVISLIRRKKDKWAMILCVFVAWITYMALYYQMDVDLERVGWLLYSYKRGMYAYLPPLLFGVSLLAISQYAFGHKNVFRRIK